MQSVGDIKNVVSRILFPHRRNNLNELKVKIFESSPLYSRLDTNGVGLYKQWKDFVDAIRYSVAEKGLQYLVPYLKLCFMPKLRILEF